MKFDILYHVDTYKPGRSFGELALLNNTKRSATIVALEDWDFGILDKENFDLVMGKILRKKFEKKVDFLTKFVFLTGMSRIKKEKLWFSMKREIFKIGQKVVIEGTEIKDIFFVERGEFEVTKYIFLHK